MYYRKRVIPPKTQRAIKKDAGHNESDRLKAIALGYEPERDDAPCVIASGSGKTAERIIAIANDNNIPIQEDPILVAALSGVDLGSTIHPEFYAVVAEILAYIYRIRSKPIQGT